MCEHLVFIVQLDPEHGVRQQFHYRPRELDKVFLWHSGPLANVAAPLRGLSRREY
jgi:hypothetical protein